MSSANIPTKEVAPQTTPRKETIQSSYVTPIKEAHPVHRVNLVSATPMRKEITVSQKKAPTVVDALKLATPGKKAFVAPKHVSFSKLLATNKEQSTVDTVSASVQSPVQETPADVVTPADVATPTDVVTTDVVTPTMKSAEVVDAQREDVVESTAAETTPATKDAPQPHTPIKEVLESSPAEAPIAEIRTIPSGLKEQLVESAQALAQMRSSVVEAPKMATPVKNEIKKRRKSGKYKKVLATPLKEELCKNVVAPIPSPTKVLPLF